MSELTTVARPYAKAAFDYAVENGAVAQWQEMLLFAAEVTKHDAVESLITGSLSTEVMSDVFINLCGEQLNEHGQNFVKVLVENKRLQALPEILNLFEALKAEYEKEVDVDITSANELSEAQLNEVSASLEKRLARKVKLNCNVDPELIAGFVVRAGDMVIDGSIKSKLNRLSDALQS